MNERQLQEIKENLHHARNGAWSVYTRLDDIDALITEVERLRETSDWRRAWKRKRKEAKVLANACRKHKEHIAELEQEIERLHKTSIFEALAEIDRLRTSNEKLSLQYATLGESEMQVLERARVAEEENERLREALEDIATRDYTLYEMLNIADKALAGEPNAI